MIQELSAEELDLVTGGWAALGGALATEIRGRVVVGIVDMGVSSARSAIGWVMNAAPGGADSGTWTMIGHSSMGA